MGSKTRKTFLKEMSRLQPGPQSRMTVAQPLEAEYPETEAALAEIMASGRVGILDTASPEHEARVRAMAQQYGCEVQVMRDPVPEVIDD